MQVFALPGSVHRAPDQQGQGKEEEQVHRMQGLDPVEEFHGKVSLRGGRVRWSGQHALGLADEMGLAPQVGDHAIGHTGAARAVEGKDRFETAHQTGFKLSAQTLACAVKPCPDRDRIQ